MLVVPFVTKDGINEPFAKTKRLLGYCLWTHLGGPILLGARAFAERAYQDWKWAVNELWEHKHHCLQMAAQIIFLWLCSQRLHAQLAHQTLRQQQHEATLAHLQYEQECYAHVAMADER
jgi:hypothetical protein